MRYSNPRLWNRDVDNVGRNRNITEAVAEQTSDPMSDIVSCSESSLLADVSKICLDWLQSLKRFFINVSYHILVASLTPMALF